MQRDTVLVIVLALLALLGLGVAAATLTDTTAPEGSGFGVGGGSGAGDTDGDGLGGKNGSRNTSSKSGGGRIAPPTVCLSWLQTPRAILAIVTLFLLFEAAAYYKSHSLLPPIAFALAFGPPVILIWAFFTACGNRQANAVAGAVPRNVTLPLEPGGGGAGGTAREMASSPSIVLGLLVAFAIVAAVVLLFVSTGDAVEEDEDEEMELPDTDVAAVGRAAGRAADRIEETADVDNEVFRAWAEMTDHLAVERPESSTPSEFAEAAVDAGMDEDDVRELTDLFETVRYGGAEATEERESRAVAALRRIEEGYAEADESESEVSDR